MGRGTSVPHSEDSQTLACGGSQSRPRATPRHRTLGNSLCRPRAWLKCALEVAPQPLKAVWCGGKRLAVQPKGPASNPSLSLSCCVASGKLLCSSELLVPYVLEQRCCKVIVQIKQVHGGLARCLDTMLGRCLLPVT